MTKVKDNLKFRKQFIGNLRTTTKFTTTSVDWERTGTRTSVSAGKRKGSSAIRSHALVVNRNPESEKRVNVRIAQLGYYLNFQTQECHFPHPFSDLASKFHASFRLGGGHKTQHACFH